MNPWPHIKYWFRDWYLDREYQAVLIDLMAARSHLEVLEAMYEDRYHHDLAEDILNYRCRVAELTDELNGVSAAIHALKKP